MNLPEEAIPQFELALQKDPDNIGRTFSFSLSAFPERRFQAGPAAA